MHVGVDKAGEHDLVRTDRDHLHRLGVRVDGEQSGDGPGPHTDGPGLLPTARNHPLGPDEQVQHAVVQDATMYRDDRPPQGAPV